MDNQFHHRSFEDGITTSQSTRSFPTAEACQHAADRATARTGELHVVCISLDPKDPKNSNEPHKSGFMVYEAPVVPVAPVAPVVG